MNKYYDFIIEDINKGIYKKCIDKADVLLFLNFVKKYLFFPVFYKTFSISNIDFLYDKISFLLKRISIIEENDFFGEIPLIKNKLEHSVDMTIKYDPSIFSREEIVLIFPSFYAIFAYRIAHLFYEKKEYLLSRMISEISHMKTGIDIHPGAVIGDYFFIDHGTGLVIGQTTIIKDFVKLYHGVTLGSSFKNDDINKRHPTIENNVTIYANSTILGGKTIIGENSIIGSGVTIRESIEKNSIVKLDTQNIVKKRSDC